MQCLLAWGELARDLPTGGRGCENWSVLVTEPILWETKIVQKLLIGFLTLVVAYVVASPYVTVYYMKAAAEQRDGEALSDYVDLPAVREDLKDQFNAKLGSKMAQEIDDNPFAVLGGLLAGVMVNKMVDTFVTPSGLIELMKGEVPKASGSGDGGDGERNKPFGQADYRYEAWDKFSVIVPDQDGDEARFILRRRGLGWKLTSVKIPMDGL